MKCYFETIERMTNPYFEHNYFIHWGHVEQYCYNLSYTMNAYIV